MVRHSEARLQVESPESITPVGGCGFRARRAALGSNRDRQHEMHSIGNSRCMPAPRNDDPRFRPRQAPGLMTFNELMRWSRAGLPVPRRRLGAPDFSEPSFGCHVMRAAGKPGNGAAQTISVHRCRRHARRSDHQTTSTIVPADAKLCGRTSTSRALQRHHRRIMVQCLGRSNAHASACDQKSLLIAR